MRERAIVRADIMYFILPRPFLYVITVSYTNLVGDYNSLSGNHL
jgi:hypothetical protein